MWTGSITAGSSDGKHSSTNVSVATAAIPRAAVAEEEATAAAPTAADVPAAKQKEAPAAAGDKKDDKGGKK